MKPFRPRSPLIPLILLIPLMTALAGCGRAPATAHVAEALGVTPDDTYFGLQSWHYNAIRVPEAWSLTTGSPNTVIAVVDSGRLSHPDLDSKWTSGYDFYSGLPEDPAHNPGTYHHGIHVAGILGAASNNGIGGAGICWSCPVMALRAMQSGGIANVGDPGLTHPLDAIARAISYAAGLPLTDDGNGHALPAHPGADVVNISLGNWPISQYDCTQLLASAVDDAIAAGTTVVAAAANGSDTGDFDASHYVWGRGDCKNAIVVTAVDANGNAEPYAAVGSVVTVAAPGGSAVDGQAGYGVLLECSDPDDPRTSGTHGVVSTWATSQQPPATCYRHWAGTSMATPHVAGVVALMRARNPSLPPARIKQILQQTAKLIPCPTTQCGAGLVDAYVAVQAATAPIDAAQFLSQSVPAQVVAGATFTASITLENNGLLPWTESRQFRLGAQNPPDNATWGLARVLLGAGESIAPGQTKTFTVTATAPATPGSYHFQWRMLREGVESFGDSSVNVDINVISPGCVTPACTPGATRACGNCGTQTCTSDCAWGACGGGGVCAPGATRSVDCYCAVLQDTCSASCQWHGAICSTVDCAPRCRPGSTCDPSP